MSTEGEVTPEVAVEQEAPVVEQEVVEEQTEGEAQPEKKEEDAPIPKGVQKRIDRAVRQKYEAEARAKMLEERLAALERNAQPQVRKVEDSEPTLDKYESFDEYVSAKAEWIAARKIEQTLSEREQRQTAEREAAERTKTAENWSRRIADATAEMPDIEDVLESASDIPMSAAMRDAILESDVGPRIAYFLATNPDEAFKIAAMTPIGAIRAIGKLEARLDQPAAKKTTSAPPPVSSVAGSASVTKNPDKMSAEEWLRWRNDQIKKRNTR